MPLSQIAHRDKRDNQRAVLASREPTSPGQAAFPANEILRHREFDRDALDASALLALQQSHGNAYVQRLIARAPSPATAKPSVVPPIQRLLEQEHKSLGDTATGGAIVNVGGDAAAERFELTYGDVVMLSGDYFEPHELMDFAKKQGNRGTVKGTRDEVVAALKDALSSDPRVQPGGVWASWVLPPGAKEGVTPRFKELDAVKQSVQDRFKQLAAKNASHYGAPRGRDITGAPKPTAKGEASAGGTYRALHEEALWIAYSAGGIGGATSHAMAMEAAAGHFLTDAFAAGHVRTPIGSMRDYWGGKYPLFWYNLLHKIALDTAAEINDQDTNDATMYGSVQAIYDEILSQVMAMAKSLPAITMGDLVAKVFHDWDNEQGVTIEGGGRLFGDGDLDKPVKPGDTPNVTRSRAQDAIRAGAKEIDAAFALGQSQPGLPKADLFKQVLGQAAGSSGVYAAEALLPRPDAANPAMNWQAPSIEALWDLPVVKGAKQTVGDQISASLQPKGDMRVRLDELALKFPATKDVYKFKQFLGTIRPQLAYRNGFVKPLVRDAKTGVLSIIHWAPNYGLGDKDRDDVSLATGQELAKGKKKGENLKGMTTLARIRYVRELTGSSVADDEEQLVIEIFRAAPASERPAIYRGVEGHDWKGDWIHGTFTSDDEIWNALKRYRLEILRNMINEGWSGRRK